MMVVAALAHAPALVVVGARASALARRLSPRARASSSR